MKIIIVTENIAGNGHYKAAISLKKALIMYDKNNDVSIITIISLLSKTIEKIIKRIYLTIITKRPTLWGWIYKRETSFSRLFRKLIAFALLPGLRHYLKKEKPDLIIATHASGIEALAMLKKEYKFKLAATFTDFNINSFWINQSIDYYFVGHQSIKETLNQEHHIPLNKIYITGIPIDPIYGEKRSKPIRKDNNFSILIMGGGLGLGGINEIVNSLNLIKEVPIALTVITGTNKKLYRELSSKKSDFQSQIEIYEYVDHIHSLMSTSHLIITKSGGLTISEALSIPVPILIYQPLPGQEEKNARFLIKNHTSIRSNDSHLIAYWVKYLYENQNLYNKLRDSAKKISRPNSAIEIAHILSQEVNHGICNEEGYHVKKYS